TDAASSAFRTRASQAHSDEAVAFNDAFDNLERGHILHAHTLVCRAFAQRLTASAYLNAAGFRNQCDLLTSPYEDVRRKCVDSQSRARRQRTSQAMSLETCRIADEIRGRAG